MGSKETREKGSCQSAMCSDSCFSLGPFYSSFSEKETSGSEKELVPCRPSSLSLLLRERKSHSPLLGPSDAHHLLLWTPWSSRKATRAQGRACFGTFAPCHLREQSCFLMKIQNGAEGCHGPSPRKAAAGSDQALCPLPADWESGLGGPWVTLLPAPHWGVYWNSSVPFLLFATNSHGSVFSVLFFFSVFLKFFFFFPWGTKLVI